MSVKKQFEKLKENWLLILLVLIILLVTSNGGNFIQSNLNMGRGIYSEALDKSYSHDSLATLSYESENYISNGGFSPEVEDRKITKTSYLTTESERGGFKKEEGRLKNIISSSGAFLLNERVSRNGEGWRGYYSGYYTIKVDSEKYDSVVSQLKEIGEIQSFSESATDITGNYEDLNVELEAEKQRLERYLDMYDDAVEVEDKINLNDKIFDQERRIKYLESRVNNLDNKIDYSTISFSMTEEKSGWTNITIVKISDLARSLINSLNSLLNLLVFLLPWIATFLIGKYFWKKFN